MLHVPILTGPVNEGTARKFVEKFILQIWHTGAASKKCPSDGSYKC